MMDISINDIAVQLLEDEPFEAFRPTVEKLIADKDQNKQRAAAEFLAGVLGGLFVYLRRRLRAKVVLQVPNIGQQRSRMPFGSGLLPIFRLYCTTTSNQIHFQFGPHS